MIVSDLRAQISQQVIKGSDCNIIYQSFNSAQGGELQSLKISTDQTGVVTIKLFENEKTYSSENPIWQVNDVVKNQAGVLIIDLREGHGISRNLKPNKHYSFSVVGAGNIHHSFLDDVYPGGNYRFEDGIERTGDLFFELMFSANQKRLKEKAEVNAAESNKNKEIKIYPNPTASEINLDGIKEKTEVVVFDSDGRVVLKKSITPNEKLKLDHLLDGAYYLRISFEGEVFTKKIIKTGD